MIVKAAALLLAIAGLAFGEYSPKKVPARALQIEKKFDIKFLDVERGKYENGVSFVGSAASFDLSALLT